MKLMDMMDVSSDINKTVYTWEEYANIVSIWVRIERLGKRGRKERDGAKKGPCEYLFMWNICCSLAVASLLPYPSRQNVECDASSLIFCSHHITIFLFLSLPLTKYDLIMPMADEFDAFFFSFSPPSFLFLDNLSSEMTFFFDLIQLLNFVHRDFFEQGTF